MTAPRPHALPLLTAASEVPPGSPILRQIQHFAEIVARPAFPCTFAGRALARDDLLYGMVPEGQDVLAGTAQLLRELASAIRADPDAVAVIFVPGCPADSLDADRRFTRELIRYLRAHDETGWPEGQPQDPEHPAWVLWFAGVDLFLNVSTANHRLRHSRNLGPTFTLVAQSRSSFDSYAGDGAVRSRIRRRLAQYDSVAVHPALGCYGSADNRESHQYFLGDSAHDEPLLRLSDIALAGQEPHPEADNDDR